MVIILHSFQSKVNHSRLESLYKEHASSMYRIAYRILEDEHLAQDAVQEAFINISNNLEKVIKADCNKIRALFIIIVRNVAIDIYRLKKKQYSISIEQIEEDIFESGPIVEEILINNEDFFRVTEIIKKLHPSYADILSLKYYYHYNDEEISRILDITPENVRTRLHRAKKSLLKSLAQEQEGKNHE